MPLSGKGMLITLMDVDADEELDFNRWYDKEHLAERVGIEGFTEARRYVAVDGRPKYLNLYTTSTFDVLSSTAYQKVLQNQTALSLHHISRFRNGGRAIVQVTASEGQGRGQALFFSAVRPSTENREKLRADIEQWLAAVVKNDDIISAHLVESDPQLSKPLTEDEPPPSASDWYILLDGTHVDSVSRQGSKLMSDANLIPVDARVSTGVYRLLWDLSKAEL